MTKRTKTNPALQTMWGKADNTRLETTIADREATIEELKTQLEQLKSAPDLASGVQRYSVDAFVPLRLREGLTQPRKHFDPTKMTKLKASIAKVGVQEPLLVRPSPDGKKLEIISGERRWISSKELNLADIPAIPRELSDEDALEIAIVANLIREDLNIVEETDSIVALISLRTKVERQFVPSLLTKIRNQRARYESSDEDIIEFLNNSADYSGIISIESISKIDEILKGFGITLDSFVSNRLSAINKMPEFLLGAVRNGRIDFTKADLIRKSKLAGPVQEDLLEEVADQGFSKTTLAERIKEIREEFTANGDASEGSGPDDISKQIEAIKKLSSKRLLKRIKGNPKLNRKLQKIQKDIRGILDELEAIAE